MLPTGGCSVRSAAVAWARGSTRARSRASTRPGEAGRDRAELAERLSGHSTRVGAAQDMVAHGIELPAIQQAGRWKSTAMATRYAERLLAARGGAAQLARLQGRDRAGARRWPPPPAVPDRAAQHRARQVQRQPDGIRPPRTGPDDRHDMPAGALAQTVEEIVRQRLPRSARPQAGDAVRPWPAGGAGPSRPDACAPTASEPGPGIAAAPRDRVSAPYVAGPGRAIENCRIRIDDRAAFAARAPAVTGAAGNPSRRPADRGSPFTTLSWNLAPPVCPIHSPSTSFPPWQVTREAPTCSTRANTRRGF